MKNVDVKKEWTGLYTCRECWEPRHPSDFQNKIDYSDDPSVPFTRPDTNANTSTTSVDGSAIETDNLTDTVGDADKVLRVDGTPRMNSVQVWNTTLTANRQATFNSTSAVDGDMFTIYYTATETAFTHSVVGETTRASTVNYIATWRFNGSAWQEKSYTPIGL
ncbi:MAG: hypothetical protein OEY29_14440 [Gammaproteobacteria bacterium]|nr:hypothetical protein [Gammaproteobacteria bacterium]